MDIGTLMDVVAMLETRINKLYWEVLPEIQNDEDSLPWEYDNASGAVQALMDFRDHLQLAIDSAVASIES